jgi:hypothetical protein
LRATVIGINLTNRDGKDVLIAAALRKTGGQNWQEIADQYRCSSARVQRMSKKLSFKPMRGIVSSHKLWQVKRGIIDPTCPLCCPEKANETTAGK